MREEGHAASAGVRAEGASLGWCTLRAASVVGVRHRLAGQRCDDSFAWAQDETRLAVAVADGIGSVEGAAGAAERAVTAAVRAALGSDIQVAVTEANRAAEGGGATTLVLAVVHPDGDAELARVGDSSAFMVGAHGEWCEVFDPPAEERLGTETPALPDPDPPVETAAASLAGGDVLALVTDGVADPWRDGPNTVAPALAAALAGHPSALELAGLADFSRQGCHDDRTILCLWRPGHEGCT